MSTPRRAACLQLLGLGLGPFAPAWAQSLSADTRAAEQARDIPEPSKNLHWLQLRASLFNDQEPASSEALALRVPPRAVDASFVPLSLAAPSESPRDKRAGLRKIYLIIDENPTALCAIFEFGPRAAPFVQTLLRINAYTHVRVVAEYADGSRFMRLQYVKAVGGCTAPPLADRAEGKLGQMSVQWGTSPPAGGERQLRWSIEHPNRNGMQMDPLSRLTPPADYLRHVRLELAQQLLFAADLDFAISEPPSFVLHLRTGPSQTGALHIQAQADDSQGREFRQLLRLEDRS